MTPTFRPETLLKFEAASASIPLRQLDRAFAAVDIRAGADPGGPEGARRIQFRRYLASIDQHDPQQLERLGVALGALIEEVADSKKAFLVEAAERDGFQFRDATFRLAGSGPGVFAIGSVEELRSIDERVRRLQLLALDRPSDAVAGATELIASACRTILRHVGKRAPNDGEDVAGLLKATLTALGSPPSRTTEALVAIIADRAEAVSPRSARLRASAAAAIAVFLSESYFES